MSRLQVSGNSRIRQRHTVVTSVPLSTAILALSPLGYWKLDDNGASTATDSSGNGRNGTYRGTGYTLQGAAGPGGTGSFVDLGNGGNNSYIEVADNNAYSINVAPGLTVFACIKPDSVAGTTRQEIVAKGGSGGAKYEWEFGANAGVAGRLHYTCHGAGGNALQFEYVDTVLSTSWQCVAFTTPDAAYNTRGNLYRNSGTALSSTQGSVNNTGSYANDTSDVWVGWRMDSPASQYWQGGIAHLAIFAGVVNLSTVFASAAAEGWF